MYWLNHQEVCFCQKLTYHIQIHLIKRNSWILLVKNEAKRRWFKIKRLPNERNFDLTPVDFKIQLCSKFNPFKIMGVYLNFILSSSIKTRLTVCLSAPAAFAILLILTYESILKVLKLDLPNLNLTASRLFLYWIIKKILLYIYFLNVEEYMI